jgi:hypothetical protein
MGEKILEIIGFEIRITKQQRRRKSFLTVIGIDNGFLPFNFDLVGV